MDEAVATRLAETTRRWRNIRGALQMVVGYPLDGEALGPEVKAAVARACAQDDFGELPEVIRETASCAALDLGALEGMRGSDSDAPRDAPG